MILSIGNSGTYEVDAFQAVVNELEKRGHKAVLFKQDKCLEGEYLVFNIINNNLVYSVVVDGRIYNIDDFSAIWYMKPHLPVSLMKFEPAEYRQFIQKQFWSMRIALWSIFRHKKWLDNPWNIQIAEDKLFQLKRAIQAGFKVPETLTTSDPNRVKSFYKKHNGNIIVKALDISPMIDKVLYTNKLTNKDITLINSVKMSPSIFQVCVSKKYELRITVVGDKIFPVKIYSQGDKATSLDWRRKPKLNDFSVKMEQTTLPIKIEQCIRHYMKSINLRYGCIDMIVAENDEYIFLEINPNGQWYFVQLHTEAQIAKAIAELLTN